MLTNRLGRSVLPTVALTLAALAIACDGAPPTHPESDRLAAPRFAGGAFTERGTFTVPAPPAASVIAPCVDDEPLQVLGTWSGWFRLSETPSGHVHLTEHIDWSDVTLRATDGRTWTPGPGAHESFSFNDPATSADLGERAYTVMHNLRARFNSADGDSDLQVWHTIHVVLGPDLELRVLRVVLPFQGKCVGSN